MPVLLTVLAGPDPDDTVTQERPPAEDYTRALDRGGLRGARLGVVRTRLFGSDRAVDALAERAIAQLRAQGAVIVDPADIDTLGTFDDLELDVLLYEFKHDLPAFFGWWGPTAPVRTVADILAFNRTHAAQELAHFGQELLELADTKGSLASADYQDARARSRRLARDEGIDLVMRRHRLDALIAPTGGVAWELDVKKGDSGSAFRPSPSTVTSVAGYPHVTVPMGFVGRLPVGLSFFGRAWSESTLIRLAYAYEQATHHRTPPRY
jgi:amidase